MRAPLLLLCLLPAALAAQDPRLSARFSREAALRITAVIDSAAAEGLPAEPLVLRALEGSIKGASPDRILLVLGRLRTSLHSARATLGPDVEAADLTVAAAALQAGVPESRVAELQRWRNGKPLTAPLGAYLDLVARGVSGEQAWTQISGLAQRRAADREYIGLVTAPRRPEDD
ncbi:MAG: hypothetical protein ABIZ70_06270 [Gemmatimonadales bacterium]